MKTTDAYNRNADALFKQYEAIGFETAHRDLLPYLPEEPASVLDVGAGSGRDAAWFAERGADVVAMEPADELRALGMRAHASSRIHWIADFLPGLERVYRLGRTFDVIWASAVWMHLDIQERERAFRKLVALLKPGGRLYVTIRRGPVPYGRVMYETNRFELEHLARRRGLSVIHSSGGGDHLGREEVAWDAVVIESPDDGLGALPLLRHIIVNDQKSSTYKLALLRVLLRIASNATGMARDLDDDRVAVPFGLVALYWIRLFHPLVKHGFLQKPRDSRDSGLAFAKAPFQALQDRSPFDFRVGLALSGADAIAMVEALKDARDVIAKMPASYIRYPGSDEPLFTTKKCRIASATPEVLVLNQKVLWSFGSFAVPRPIWHALGRYGVWVEPAIVSEWAELMARYEGRSAPIQQHDLALRWLDPEHETGLVRKRLAELLSDSKEIRCVWTGRRLTENFAVDHCLPFSAWPCNDLWNLLPSDPRVNSSKGNRLPSPETLFRSREGILQWWENGYLALPSLAQRFFEEGTASLPFPGSLQKTEDVFEGVLLQRAVLKHDQQVADWSLSP